MIAIAKTHIGRVRKANEDALLCLPGLYAVADGMGGHKAGEVASQGALKILQDRLEDKSADAELLEQAVQAANRRLYQQQTEDEALEGMGTTLTALWQDEGQVLIGHVGDSRVYLYCNGIMRQITQDHSLVAEMVAQGLLTKEKAQVHPYRNVITRAVGTAANIQVDIYQEKRQAGDMWLICSDGLYGMAGEDGILHAFEQQDMEKAAQELLELALENGGKDNITLVLLRDEEAAR